MNTEVLAHTKTSKMEGFPPHAHGPSVSDRRSRDQLDNQSFCSTVRCLLFTAFVVIGLMAAALVFLSVKAIESDDDDDDDDIFDDFFRTPEEQARFEEEVLPLEDNLYPTGFTKNTDRCNFKCSGQGEPADDPIWPTSTEGSGSGSFITNLTFDRQRRQVVSTHPPVRHACCVSRVLFIKPSEATNIFNERLIVVQEERRAQYFKSYNCSHVVGCTGCGCCQSQEHRRAVVTRPNKNRRFLATIVLPGCCKCYNNLDPASC